jgi:hypothetical protein
MNHWIWLVSLVAMASPSAGTEIMGFFSLVRRRADADLGPLGDLVQPLAGRIKQGVGSAGSISHRS